MGSLPMRMAPSCNCKLRGTFNQLVAVAFAHLVLLCMMGPKFPEVHDKDFSPSVAECLTSQPLSTPPVTNTDNSTDANSQSNKRKRRKNKSKEQSTVCVAHSESLIGSDASLSSAICSSPLLCSASYCEFQESFFACGGIAVCLPASCLI